MLESDDFKIIWLISYDSSHELTWVIWYESHETISIWFIANLNRLIRSAIGWRYLYKKGVFHSRSVSIPSGKEKFLQSYFPPVSSHFCTKIVTISWKFQILAEIASFLLQNSKFHMILINFWLFWSFLTKKATFLLLLDIFLCFCSFLDVNGSILIKNAFLGVVKFFVFLLNFRFFFVEPLIALSRNAVLMSVHYIHSRLILNILFWVLSFHWLRDGSTINCTQWYSNQYCESVTKHVEFVSKFTSKITVKSTQLSFLPAKNGQNDQKLIESAQIWPKMI